MYKQELTIKKNDLNKFCAQISCLIKQNDIIAMIGDLGSGKTTIAKHIINKYLESNFDITSPTFPIIKYYEFNNKKIYHMDLYRIKSQHELIEIGITDILSSYPCIIEWPDIIKDAVITMALFLELSILDAETRHLAIYSHSKNWQERLSMMQKK